MNKGYIPPFTMTDEITNLVIEIGELVGSLEINNELSKNPILRRENRIKTIYSSLAIEQNTLSLEQVTDVINDRRVLAPLEDIKEVKNAFEVYNLIDKFNENSIDDLLLAHKLMTQELIKESGIFRSKGAGVFQGKELIHAGTPPQYILNLMQELFHWLKNSKIHPLIKSCIFHYEFEFIHPFSDGNGRIGRFWHTLILSKWKKFFSWLPIETLIHEKQQEYYFSINQSNKNGESTVFIEFMLNIIKETLIKLQIDNKKKKMTDKTTDKMTDKFSKNEIERFQILHKYFEKKEKISNSELQELLDISEITAKRFLKKLTNENILEAIGERKNRRYKLKK